MFIIWSILSWFIALSAFAFAFIYTSLKMQVMFVFIGVLQIIVWYVAYHFVKRQKIK